MSGQATLPTAPEQAPAAVAPVSSQVLADGGRWRAPDLEPMALGDAPASLNDFGEPTSARSSAAATGGSPSIAALEPSPAAGSSTAARPGESASAAIDRVLAEWAEREPAGLPMPAGLEIEVGIAADLRPPRLPGLEVAPARGRAGGDGSGDALAGEDDGVVESPLLALATPSVGGGLVLSASLLIWATRAGGLVAAMMASVPAWRSFDPLPILARVRDDKDDPPQPDAGDADVMVEDLGPQPVVAASFTLVPMESGR
jgi:hypothetical protein